MSDRKVEYPPVLTTAELAEMLGVSENSALRANLPGTQIGGKWRFVRDQVLEVLKKRAACNQRRLMEPMRLRHPRHVEALGEVQALRRPQRTPRHGRSRPRTPRLHGRLRLAGSPQYRSTR